MLHAMADRASGADVTLYAFTVDHALRAESADEADYVAGICRHLEIAHRVLKWEAPCASQNAARLARHRMLAQASRAVGARFLCLGHTLDDVIETRAMRTQRGEVADRTVGPMPVSVSPVWPQGRGTLLLRPLLLSRRDDLRAWLTGRGLRWIDDPSNESDAYERPRVRKMLAKAPLAADADGVLQFMQARARSDARLAAPLKQCAARCDDYGLIRVPATVDQDTLIHLISILVPVAAGTDRIPKAYARLSAMQNIVDEASTRYTIGGAWLQRQDGDILIGREPGRGDAVEADGVFDGRFVRDAGAVLPEQPPHFLVRHAVPEAREGWKSLIPARLEAHADAVEANAALLTTPRAADPF